MPAIKSNRRSRMRYGNLGGLRRGGRLALGQGIEQLENRVLLATHVVDFDGVDASLTPVSGAALANYLDDFGITISNTTANITPVIANENNPPQGFHVGTPSSSPNYFITDNVNNDAYSYRINFARPLMRFAFTRIDENGGSALIASGWTARALDIGGATVDTVGEGEHTGTAKNERQFALEGDSIVAVVFERTTTTLAGLNAAPFDDWVLTEAIGQAPVANSQSVTTTINTSKSITLSATDGDNDPLTYSIVTFPSHGSISGTAPNVLYTPSANYTGPDSFSFKANDGDGDSNIATVSINVLPFNGNPVITTNTGSMVARGGTDIISMSELLTSDSNTAAEQLVYSVVSPPVNGFLQRGTQTISSFTQADINAGLVKYVHNGTQTASDNFLFTVSDGQTTLPATAFNFSVTGNSGAPVISANTGSSVVQGEIDTITSGELNTTDSNTSAASLTYTVTGAPTHGVLLLGNSPTSTFTQADINAGLVKYDHIGDQSTSDSFVFSVSDGSTTLPNNTFLITVTGASGTPTITTNTGSSVVRSGSDVITSAELFTTDSNTSANGLLYTITTAPTQGMLRLDGLLTNSFTQADINANRVTYLHQGGAATSDTFGFRVSDGTTTLPVNIFTITVTGTSSGPTITTNTGLSVTRGGTEAITSLKLNSTDPDTGAAGLTYTVTSGPSSGSVRRNGIPVNSFTQAEINAGIVTYVHNNSLTNSDSFIFSVSDGTTTVSGNTFAITIAGASGAPVITTNSGSTVTQGGTDLIAFTELNTTDANTPPDQLTYSVTAGPANGTLRRFGIPTLTFSQADINSGLITYVHNGGTSGADSFGFTVSDGTTTLSGNTFRISVAGVSGAPTVATNTGSTVLRAGSDTILSNELTSTDTDSTTIQLVYTVTTPPANGTLRRNGSPTSTFTQADINAGIITYQHNGSVANSDAFVFSLSDGTTTLPGNTFKFTVTTTTSPPVVSTNTGSIAARGGSDLITTTELNTTDSDNTAAQLVYTVTSAPVNGTLSKGGLPTTTFTQADINAGIVSYVHNGGLSTSDSFVFSVSDGTSTVSGRTFSFTITGTSGAPVVTTNTGSSVGRGGSDVISSTELLTVDANTSAAQLTYTVTTSPIHGSLRKNGVATTTFTQADINAGLITYVHDGTQTNTDSFRFNVSDGSTTVVGTTFAITIGGGGAAPVISTNGGSTVLEGRTDVITMAELNTTDPDDGPATLVYTVTNAPTNGTLRLNGAPTSTFTQADINANRVTYLHNGSETTFDVFAFRVSDGANVVGPTTFLISVTPVDDAVVVLENGNLNVETDDRDDIVTITGVGAGTGVYTVVVQQGTASQQTFNVSGVTGSINVNLHGGNDRLTINNALINGSLDIQMEDGNDIVTAGDKDVVSTKTQLRIDLGAGDDTLNGKRLYIGTDQFVHGGEGNDQLLFEGVAQPEFTLGTSAAGLAFWSGGGGNDTVRVAYAFIVRSWGVFLGDGADSLNVFGSAISGDVIFSGDAGNDTLTVDTNFMDATLVINALAGADTVFLANGLGTEFASIAGGDGNDQVTVRNQTTKHLRIEGGAGADKADVQSSAFDRFFAALGDDNDELTVRGNLVQLETDLDGGAGGADRLLDLGNTFRGASRNRAFELFS